MIKCIERQQYTSSVKGFATNSADWLFSCMIESFQSFSQTEHRNKNSMNITKNSFFFVMVALALIVCT